MIHPKQKRVVAYCVEANKDYRLDLSPYGVRPSWTTESIWTVARREMKNIWNKPVTSWVVEEKAVF